MSNIEKGGHSMKRLRVTLKRTLAAVLAMSMLFPVMPQTNVAAETTSESNATTDTVTDTKSLLAGTELDDTYDSVIQPENDGLNPLTGYNDRPVTVNPSYELMVGRVGALNQEEGSQNVEQRVYDLGDGYLPGDNMDLTLSVVLGDVVKNMPEYSDSDDNGKYYEAVSAIRTVAYDPFGKGKDTYVAELTAKPTWQGGTAIWLTTYDATKSEEEFDRWYSDTFCVAYLDFKFDEWQADAYMQMSPGDFDGDGKDELAIYFPTGESYDDGTQEIVNPYVAIYGLVEYDADLVVFEQEGKKYYIDTTRGSNHNEPKDFSNSIRALCAVDLETIRRPGLESDSLAIATSPPRNGKGTGAITKVFDAATQVDVWLDTTKEPSGGNLSKHDMRWPLHLYYKENSFNNIYYKAEKHYDAMMYGGLAAGDINGDGVDELVVAGYRIRYTGTTNNWTLDDRYLFTEVLFSSAKVYADSGIVPQSISIKKNGKQFNKVAPYLTGNSPTSSENAIASPVSVTCYKARGRDFADVIFMAGQVYEWKESYKSSFIRYNEAGVSRGGYAKIAELQTNGKEDTHNGLITYAGATGKYWISNVVAGNLDNNPYGIEQLYCVFNYTNGSKIGSAILGITKDVVGEYNTKFTNRTYYNKIVNRGECASTPLCIPDVDDDASYVRYNSQEIYYSNPQPVAILQAPPYHKELDQYDGDYVASGATVFETSKGGGGSTTHGFNATVGAIIGVEQEVSFFGLAKTGFSSMLEISVGAGYENTATTTKNFAVAYKATGTDQVVVMITPYIRYEYDVTNPTLTTKTEEELKALKKEIDFYQSLLESDIISKEIKEKLTKPLFVMNDNYTNQKSFAEKYGYGKTIKGETMRMTYSQPGEPTMTMLTKDAYNSLVTSLGANDLLITDDVLKYSEPGNVASYFWNDGAPSGLLTMDDFSGTSSGSFSGSTIIQTISEEEELEESITWNAGISNETTVSAGGVTTGVSASLEYSGSNASIQMNGVTIEGEVALIPEGANSNYEFKWKVGTWKTNIGGNPCRVIGYQVAKMVDSSLSKFPPKPVTNVTVEEIENADGGYGGVKVKWYPAAEDSKYGIYYHDPTAFVISVNNAKKKEVQLAAVQKTDSEGKTYYETTLDSIEVIAGHPNVIGVQAIRADLGESIQSTVSYADVFYRMSSGSYAQMFTMQPEDYVYDGSGEDAETTTAEFTSELDLGFGNLEFTRDSIKWQYCEPDSDIWKDVETADAASGILSANSSITTNESNANVKLTVEFNETAVGTKFRLVVPFAINGDSENTYEAKSKEAQIKDDRPKLVEMKSSVTGAEDGRILYTATGIVEDNGTGYVSNIDIAALLKNLTNSSASRNLLLRASTYGAELPAGVNTTTITPGVYQLIASDKVSDEGSITSEKIVAYGDEPLLLGTTAEKIAVQAFSMRAAGTTENKDVDTITFGERLKLNTSLYRKDATDPNAPEGITGLTYRVVTADGNDVTNDCITAEGIFTPDRAGEFTIYISAVVDGETVESKKIVKVLSSGERYASENLKKVLDAQPDDITGIVYGSAKTAEALALPKSARVQTDNGSVYVADIAWDLANCSYNPANKTEQTFTVNGNVILPSYITNDDSVSTNVSVQVTVNEEIPTVDEPILNETNEDKATGTITVGTKIFTDYKNNIAFDTVFDTAQKVTITAEDAEEGITLISYIKSNTAMTLEQLENATNWTDGTELNIAVGEQCVIYARIVNGIGNVTYLSTGGIVIKSGSDNASNSSNNTTAGSNTNVNTNAGEQLPVKGKTYTVGKLKYKVTANGKNKTIQIVGTTNRNIKTLNIPATVKIGNVKFKVTSIKANAFKNKKKLKKVVIGKNVTKIGKKAFYGCKNLKNIVIKTTKLKKNSIGKKAFANISKKPTFKVPKKKLKNYRTFIKKSKVPAKSKITK